MAKTPHKQICRTIAFVLLLLVSLPLEARPPKRMKKTAVQITLDKTNVTLKTGEQVEVKANLFDRRGNTFDAKVSWTVITGKSLVSIRTLGAYDAGLIVAANSNDPQGVVLIRARSGGASADLKIELQRPSTPAEILFPGGLKYKLPVQGHQEVQAKVFDDKGNLIKDAEIRWNASDPDHESFVSIGPNVNKDGVNSTTLTWLGGKADLKPPSEIKLVARSGDKARGIVTLAYEVPAPENVTITTDPAQLALEPGEAASVRVTVRSKDDERLLKDAEIQADIADETGKKYFVATTNKQTVTVLAYASDDKSPPPSLLKTALIIRTKNGTNATIVPLTFQGEPATVYWDVLPPRIVGDNYGRTVRNDYYCIEVTIENHSGGDLAIAGLRFVTKPDGIEIARPNTSYSTVHGSLARRKLTHPRTMMLAIIDGTASLMTGFNPFFHNLNHANNFSLFIDILSNPLAKGLDKAWKDPYPEELSRFEQDVLHDDKIIPNNQVLKAKIFFPKRSLFENSDGNRDDPSEVRKRLGTLQVLGYKFQKGQVLKIGSSN